MGRGGDFFFPFRIDPFSEGTQSNIAILTAHNLSISGLCSFANSFLTDVNKSTILQLHNRLRRNFANGAQGVMVADMNKLVSVNFHNPFMN